MKKGFSLVEILVSIAIISILSGIGISTFYASRQRARLEEDVSKIVMAIRRTQNAALAPSKSETGVGETETLYSMGVRINGGNISKFYTTATSPTNKRIYGNSNDLNYSSINPNSVDFEFLVPFADTSGGSIRISNGGFSKIITVTNSGLIKVQ
jgi:prepilin-type N-terminal cleavage/methylation domain-containing protein